MWVEVVLTAISGRLPSSGVHSPIFLFSGWGEKFLWNHAGNTLCPCLGDLLGRETVWATLAKCPSPLLEKLLLSCKNLTDKASRWKFFLVQFLFLFSDMHKRKKKKGLLKDLLSVRNGLEKSIIPLIFKSSSAVIVKYFFRWLWLE